MDSIAISILLVVIGLIVGFILNIILNSFKENNANKKVEQILEKARKDAEKVKRDQVLETKEVDGKTLARRVKDPFLLQELISDFEEQNYLGKFIRFLQRNFHHSGSSKVK